MLSGKLQLTPMRKRLLLYSSSSCLLLLLVIFSFYLLNPFTNECIHGNCKNGYGVYVSHSGMKYEGEWENGKRHGKGTLTYPDGSKYDGEWKDNRMHGYGVKAYIDARLYKYSGEWENGIKNGEGTEIFTSGEQYVGEWENGEMHGIGTFTTFNGREIKGKRNYGVLHGTVTETFPDGRILIAEWKNNKRHGPGIFTYPDGTKVKVEWVNHILVGSSDFYLIEFQGAFRENRLYSAINADINISLNTPENFLKWLNELLKVPNLYEELYEKIHDARFSKEIDMLVEKTKDFRNKRFSELNNDRQKDIKRLNRLLLEHFYPGKTPKRKW